MNIKKITNVPRFTAIRILFSAFLLIGLSNVATAAIPKITAKNIKTTLIDKNNDGKAGAGDEIKIDWDSKADHNYGLRFNGNHYGPFATFNAQFLSDSNTVKMSTAFSKAFAVSFYAIFNGVPSNTSGNVLFVFGSLDGFNGVGVPRGNGFGLTYNKKNELEWSINNERLHPNTQTAAIIPQIGAEHHILYTWDGSRVLVYIDGKIAIDNVYNNDVRDSNHSFTMRIGAWVWKDFHSNASMRDVKVYNKFKTVAQSLDDNNKDGLLSYWKFDEDNTGTSIYSVKNELTGNQDMVIDTLYISHLNFKNRRLFWASIEKIQKATLDLTDFGATSPVVMTETSSRFFSTTYTIPRDYVENKVAKFKITANNRVTTPTYTASLEVSSGITTSNLPPIIDSAGPFTVLENLANGTFVAQMTATDHGSASADLVYSISDAVTNTSKGAFAIDNTGKITVKDSSKIDFENNPYTFFSMIVKATDKQGAVSRELPITINIIDVPEHISFDKATSDGEESENAEIIVKISPAVTTDSVIGYRISGRALLGMDYHSTSLAPSGTVTIPAGSTTATIFISVVDDKLSEGPESIIITLDSATGGTLAGGIVKHTYTINDNDSPIISFESAASSIGEGDAMATIAIKQAVPSVNDSVFDYKVIGGTATNGKGKDYELSNGRITIKSGDTAASIKIPTINDDQLVEGSETIIIELTFISGDLKSGIGKNKIHTLTINDNDLADIHFNTDKISVNEGTGFTGKKDVSLALTQKSSSVNDITVNYTVSGSATNTGTANTSKDHNLADGSFIIKAGDTTANIDFSVYLDGVIENDETIIVTLTGTAGDGTIGGGSLVYTYTITNDDALPTLSNISIKSDNGAEISKAELFNNVIVGFTADKELITPAVNIIADNGNTATVTISNASSDKMNWTATRKMTGDDTLGDIKFNINFEDTYGNIGAQVVKVTDNSSVNYLGDITSPVITANSLKVAAAGASAYTIPLVWSAGNDNGIKSEDITYKVYYSSKADIDTIKLAEAATTASFANATTANPLVGKSLIRVNQLVPETTYYLNVIASDTAGNKVAYKSITVTTTKFSKVDSDGDGIADDYALNANVPLKGGKSTDADHDGVTDAVEAYLQTLKSQGVITPVTGYNDSDGDGIPDATEFSSGNQDGILDSNIPVKNGQELTNDGVKKGVKYYLTTLNIKNATDITDADFDLIPDAVEVRIGSNPLLSDDKDIDTDGLSDAVEAFLSGAVAGGTATGATTAIFSTGGSVVGSATGTAKLPDYAKIGYSSAGFDGKAITSVSEWLTRSRVYSEISSAGEAGGDDDNDGVSNIKELMNGTNPFISSHILTTYTLDLQFNGNTVTTLNNTSGDFVTIYARKIGAQGNSSEKFVWNTKDSKITDASGLSYDNIFKNGALIQGNSGTKRNVVFTARNVEVGTYVAQLTVSDKGKAVDYTTVFKVTKKTAETDSDRDGIPDSKDKDHGGLQSIGKKVVGSNTYVIQATVNNKVNNAVIISAGSVAKEYSDSANVSVRNLKDAGLPVDDKATHVGGIFDFIVSGVPANSIVHVIIPLGVKVPANAVYRKLDNSGNWSTFDAVESAAGTALGNCSNISNWTNGLNVGDTCVRLTLTDGDITWDNDGEANGTIVDPSGVAYNNVSVVSGGGLGGGCAIAPTGSETKFDPILYLLALFAMIGLLRRYVIKYSVGGLLAAMLLVSPAGNAATNQFVYVGIGGTLSSLSPDLGIVYKSDSSSDVGYNALIGSRINKSFAVEASYVDMGGAKVKKGSSTSKINYTQVTLGGVYYPLGYKLLSNKLSPFIGAGVRRSATKWDDKPANATLTTEDSVSTYFTIGGDVSIGEDQDNKIRLNYSRYSSDASGLSLTWIYDNL